MKFDFCIGNPPYQEETTNISETNGQLRRKSIFHYFQQEADKLTKESTVMIYPAGRWIQRSGKGMKEFGYEQINDPHLQEVFFYPDSSDVFSGVAIADGISIVVKKMNKNTNTFKYIYSKNGQEIAVEIESPRDNIIPLNPNDIIIVKKIEDFVKKYNLKYMHDRVHPQKLFAIESDFVEKNAQFVRTYTSDSDIDFETEIKLYANDKAGKAGRTTWFVAKKDIITTNKEYVAKWKVVVSSANAGGQKRDNQLEIIDNHSAFGRSRVALASFETKREAENFYRYVRTYIIKFAFLLTDEALTTLAMKVPDFESYKDDNGMIDYSKDLDEQLFELVGLSEAEIAYVKNKIHTLR